jgi:hypothetical protein
MLDDLLDLPISRLWETAKKNHLKLGISIDSANGKSWLDTLDIWDGSPGQIGSTCICRASLIDSTLDEAASNLLKEMEDGLAAA